MTNNVGILLTNIGTPAAPTPKAVRDYLKTFLLDPRVVEIPRAIWLPILYGFILPFRAKRSAQLYQSIWTDQGSPLLINSQNIAKKLQAQLNLPVELGMQYSEPSIAKALNALKAQNVDKIMILPLYPQYSGTSTASTFDRVTGTLKQWRNIPQITFIKDYADNPDYIQALCQSIRTTWETQGKQFLLFSFHGIPERYTKAGDPYPERCALTARLVANQLQLADNEWSLAFQSRLGRAKWLTPYTDVVLKELPKRGITNMQVICPGFAVDCLETLEEIAIRGKEVFLTSGGKSLHYIPALNDSHEHIIALSNIMTLAK